MIQYDANKKLMIGFLPPRPHMCPHSGCPCVSLVVLMVQALFELKRGLSGFIFLPPLKEQHHTHTHTHATGDDVLPMVLRFYPAGPIPFAVVHVTALLLIHLKKLPEAQDFLEGGLDSPSLLPTQRHALVELLVARIVAPLHGREAALQTVSWIQANDLILSDHVLPKGERLESKRTC